MKDRTTKTLILHLHACSLLLKVALKIKLFFENKFESIYHREERSIEREFKFIYEVK